MIANQLHAEPFHKLVKEKSRCPFKIAVRVSFVSDTVDDIISFIVIFYHLRKDGNVVLQVGIYCDVNVSFGVVQTG